MTWRTVSNRLHYFRKLPPGGNYAAQSLCQRAFLSSLPTEPPGPPLQTVLICGACNLRAPDADKKIPPGNKPLDDD